MVEIQGLGSCGVCGMHIDEGVPIRGFKGHIMAHADCMKKWSADDQRLFRAREKVATLDAQIGAMTADRDSAQKIIDETVITVKQ